MITFYDCEGKFLNILETKMQIDTFSISWVSYLKLICFLHKVPFVFSSFCDGIYLGFTQIMVTGLLKHWGLLGNFVPLINVDASRHQAFKDQPEIGQESHFECRCLECIVYWPIDGASV